MSLRDQLLKVGLINQQQANEAERQLQRQERRPPQKKRHDSAGSAGGHAAPAGQRGGAPGAQAAARSAPGPGRPAPPPAHLARDQALNRQKQEKALRKARQAEIRQLIAQHRLPPIDAEEFYAFVEGGRVRRVRADAALRSRLSSGEITIVRQGAGYALVPEAIAARIRERDPLAWVYSGVSTEPAPAEPAAADDPYAAFAVPDDLRW